MYFSPRNTDAKGMKSVRLMVPPEPQAEVQFSTLSESVLAFLMHVLVFVACYL